MVLDSTVGPGGVWWADNLDQDYAFQGRIQAFFAWVAKYASVYHLGATAQQVSQNWYQARAQLAAHPVPGPSGRPMIGPDEWDDTFLIGGYDNGYWPGLAIGARRLPAHGARPASWSRSTSRQGVQNENEFAVYNAVECSDVNWPRNWATWDSDDQEGLRRPRRSRPGTTHGSTRLRVLAGPAGRRSRCRSAGAGLPGILMLQGTLDAATPYAGALAAHRLLPSARMVVVKGGGNHGQSLASPPNTCVNGYLNRYLATGALPRHAGPGQRDLPGPADPRRSGPGEPSKPCRHAPEAASPGPAAPGSKPLRWIRATHQGMAVVVAAPAD